MEYLSIIITSVFISNYVLSQMLGLCPFIGVSKKVDSAIGMGAAVIFVMTLASFITFFVYKFVLVPYELAYLRTLSFILVIASLVQLVEMAIEKLSPALYQSLGIFLPLITTNCAVFGLTLINIKSGFLDPEVAVGPGLLKSIVQGVGAGIGFTLALVLMAGIRERLETAAVPKNLAGIPITYITAGLMALAFLGFAGMRIY